MQCLMTDPAAKFGETSDLVTSLLFFHQRRPPGRTMLADGTLAFLFERRFICDGNVFCSSSLRRGHFFFSGPHKRLPLVKCAPPNTKTKVDACTPRVVQQSLGQ